MEVEHDKPMVESAPTSRTVFDEVRESVSAVPHKGVFLILLLSWIGLFHFFGNSTFGYANTPSLFGWLLNIYQHSPDDESFAYLVPILMTALLWWKRAELVALPKAGWWPSCILLFCAVVLHLVGYVIQQQRISVVGLFLGLYALTGIVWGWRWLKATFFPMFLLAFLIPLPMDLEGMTLPLRLVSTKISVSIGHLLGISDVAGDGTLIVFPERHLRYEVEAACSGLRSLTVMTAMSCIFAFVTFKSHWKRLLVIASAAPLAILSNSLRLLSIIIGGNWKYDQLKSSGLPLSEVRLGAQSFGGYIHDHAVIKLVPYALGFVGLMLLAKWLRDQAETPAEAES